ncbi:MAG TPA: hypothetical protein VFM47_01065 [Gaiellales bacterium]|nr:hypothetical protein [Gaiellales bacterium]
MSISRWIVVVPVLVGLAVTGSAVARMMPRQTVRDTVYQTCQHNGVHFNKQGHANCGLHKGWSDDPTTSTGDEPGSQPGDQPTTESGGSAGHAPKHGGKSNHGKGHGHHSATTSGHGHGGGKSATHSGRHGHATTHGGGHGHAGGQGHSHKHG